MNEGLEHISFRKRLYSRLDPFPHPVAWKAVYDRFMYMLGLLTPVVLLPQLWNTWVLHDVEGVSIFTWLGFGIINLFWVAYGIIHKERAISTSNILFAFFNFSIAIGVLVYR